MKANRSERRTESMVSRVTAQCPVLVGHFEFIQLDLTDRASIHKFVSTVAERGVKIDILVNNAGMTTADATRLTNDGIHVMWGASYIMLPIIMLCSYQLSWALPSDEPAAAGRFVGGGCSDCNGIIASSRLCPVEF